MERHTVPLEEKTQILRCAISIKMNTYDKEKVPNVLEIFERAKS